MNVAKPTMTSRERLLAALNHRQPDRVPIDLGGNQTGIHKFAYEALVRYLGLDEQIEIMDAVQQLARPSEAVLQRLRVDTRYIHAGSASGFDGTIVTARRDGKRWHDLVDEFGVRWSMPEDAPLYMDITHHPLAEASIADVSRYPWPRGDDPGRFAGLRERAQKDPRGNALCAGERHQRSGLRNMLVYARSGAMVHGHARAARVLRGHARPDIAILARLVPGVPRRSG